MAFYFLLLILQSISLRTISLSFFVKFTSQFGFVEVYKVNDVLCCRALLYELIRDGPTGDWINK